MRALNKPLGPLQHSTLIIVPVFWTLSRFDIRTNRAKSGGAMLALGNSAQLNSNKRGARTGTNGHGS